MIMHRLTLNIFIGIASLTLFSFVAHAQTDSAVDSNAAPSTTATSSSTAAPKPGDAKKAVGGKRTTIDFEDELIEGQTQKPDLFYLLQKRQFNYKRMIRLRENFLPEMRKTSEDMQRKGSGD